MSNYHPTFDPQDFSDLQRELLSSVVRRSRLFVKSAKILRRPDRQPVALSFAQQQVWVDSQLAGEIALYNEPVTIHRNGPLDIWILEKCLVELVRRHEIWRTIFSVVDGEPVQTVRPAPHYFSIPEFDLRAFPEAEREAEASLLAEEDVRRPFDLSTGPLLRAILLRLDEAEYRLHMTFHHIVFDGYTAHNVLLPELVKLYESFSRGDRPTLPELEVQYSDFAYWQSSTSVAKDFSAHKTYWHQQFRQGVSQLNWPRHRGKAPSSHRGAIYHFEFPPSLIAELARFSRNEYTSLYATMLTGLAAVLFRYTGQPEIIIGTLSAGRQHTQLETMAGDFIVPLPLRIDLRRELTFRELLQSNRTLIFEALSHDGLPFTEILRALHVNSVAGANLPFQVLLSMQPRISADYPGWDLTMEDVSNGGSKVDLIITMDQRGTRLFGPISYNPDRFDVSMIARMVDHWRILLAGAMAAPDCPISRLPVLTEAERNQVLFDWNHTNAAEQPRACVHQMIEAQAEQTPLKTAMVFGRTRLTYREINEFANKFSRYLQKFGVTTGDLVAVCMERSPEMFIAILGILKAGAAYVPIDPSFPKARVDMILKDAAPKVVVTTSRASVAMGWPDSSCIRFDSERANILKEDAASCSVARNPDDLAYVIFTSGSTGKPKGVCIPHSALTNFLSSMRHQPGITAKDILLAVTTISFDIAGLELFLPLITGAQCVLAPKDALADGAKLSALLKESGATILQATPITWRILLMSGWRGKKDLKALCGGEALTQELISQLLPRVGSLWNMYGPTETTIWSLVKHITSLDEPVTIGRPIANTQTYVLDDDLVPVPIGIPSELYIGGAGLARGYYEQPALTAERFLPNPFLRDANARIYKTGDQVRLLPNGEFEYLGRNDHQVKVHGFRVELGDIECALLQQPGVSQAVVKLESNPSEDQRLIAYVVPSHPEISLNISQLKDALRKTLPQYMLPTTIMQVTALPVSVNGKIDRSSLPTLDSQPASHKKRTIEAPRTPVEQKLSEIWCRVLGVGDISRNDTFFDLGGNSLSLIKLLHWMEKSFNVKLSVSSVLEAPALAELARLLEKKQKLEEPRFLVPIQPRGSRPPLFFVHGASGTVLIYRDLSRRLGPDQPFYGLRANGLESDDNPHTRIEEMAQAYLEDIRTVQPHGPYFLGGYCLGGTITLEIAQLLRSQGEEVPLLALLETTDWSRLRPDSLLQRVSRQYERLRFHCRNFLLLSSRDRHRFFSAKVSVLKNRIKIWRAMFLSKMTGADDIQSPSAAVAKIWQINDRAARDYVPRPYPGVVTHFRPLQDYSEYAETDKSWDALALGGSHIVRLRVYPAGMLLEPFVEELAHVLKTFMDEAFQDKHVIEESKLVST
jgi:amino acid adenylation domain-containing protein